jgi:hypothetical protein
MNAKDLLNDYLRGMAQHERGIFTLLSEEEITALAQAELKRRAAVTLQRFDSEIIAGLTTGDISLHRAIADVCTA